MELRHKFRNATTPIFEELYNKVSSGEEADVVIKANAQADYRSKLNNELKEIRESELWQAGKKVRSLRPEHK